MMKRVPVGMVLAFCVSLAACDKKPAGSTQSPPATKPAERPVAKPDSAPDPLVAVPPAPPLHPDPVVPAAFAAALELSDPAAREQALQLAVLNLPPENAADLLVAKLPADAMRANLLGGVLVKLAIQEPAAAAKWLSTAQDIPEKPAAIRATADLWQRLNFAATLKWIGTLHAGRERTSALQAIAGRIALTPVEHQAQELGAIPDAAMRAEVESLMHAH